MPLHSSASLWLRALVATGAVWAIGSAPALAATQNDQTQNITVAGNTAAGKSPTFAQYCPNNGGCGTDAFGYIPGGKTLPANSLTLNTTSASSTTTLGGPATFTCNNTPCDIDSATPSKIATESAGMPPATWNTTGFSATSLALSTPTTLNILPASEVYRVDIVWTLNTGP